MNRRSYVSSDRRESLPRQSISAAIYDATSKEGIIKRTIDARTARPSHERERTEPVCCVCSVLVNSAAVHFRRTRLSNTRHLPLPLPLPPPSPFPPPPPPLSPPPPLFADGRSIDPTGPTRRARRTEAGASAYQSRLATSSATLTGRAGRGRGMCATTRTVSKSSNNSKHNLHYLYIG